MSFQKKLFLLIALAMLITFCVPAISALAETPTASGGPKETNLIVPIGNLNENTVSPGTYINTIFKWGIGLAALLALGRVVLGGVKYTLSAGSISSRESATETIKNSVIGLIILLIGVTAFVTINPSLIKLSPIDANREDFQQSINAVKATGEQIAAANAQTAAFDTAARAADARNAYNIECKKTAEELIERIDYQRDQATITGQIISAGQNILSATTGIYALYHVISGVPGTDFGSVLQKAANNKSSNHYLYHCYQDAIISALGYAKGNLTDNAFALAIAELKNQPQELGANEYLTSDPAGRTSATVASMGLEFAQQGGSIQQKMLAANNKLANKDLDGAVTAIEKMYQTEANTNAVTTAAYYLLNRATDLYKNNKLTVVQNNYFYEKMEAVIVQHQ